VEVFGIPGASQIELFIIHEILLKTKEELVLIDYSRETKLNVKTAVEKLTKDLIGNKLGDV
jgi:hypothetical protein